MGATGGAGGVGNGGDGNGGDGNGGVGNGATGGAGGSGGSVAVDAGAFDMSNNMTSVGQSAAGIMVAAQNSGMASLIQQGIMSLPTLGDGRQSGTSDSPSILNASPESAAGGGLAWLRNGDMIRVDLNAGTCDMLVDAEEIARRQGEGLPEIPPSNTPWEELYREKSGQLSEGGVLEFATKYRGTGLKVPRHNH